MGTEIKIENKEPFDDSIEVSYKDFHNILLTKEVCEKLLVEKVDK